MLHCNIQLYYSTDSLYTVRDSQCSTRCTVLCYTVLCADSLNASNAIACRDCIASKCPKSQSRQVSNAFVPYINMDNSWSSYCVAATGRKPSELLVSFNAGATTAVSPVKLFLRDPSALLVKCFFAFSAAHSRRS